MKGSIESFCWSRDIPLTAELPKDSEPELPKTEEVVIEENTEKKASPPEEEIKVRGSGYYKLWLKPCDCDC